jgi:hypothetical protein
MSGFAEPGSVDRSRRVMCGLLVGLALVAVVVVAPSWAKGEVIPATLPATPGTPKALIKNFTMTSTGPKSVSGTVYTVPAGKWFAITSISVHCVGANRLNAVQVYGYEVFLIEVPFSMLSQGTRHTVRSFYELEREQWVPPGTAVAVIVSTSGAATSGSGYNGAVYINGYLSSVAP